jgi:hypothetical protein
LPVAEREHARCLAAPHFCLLGDEQNALDIGAAFQKVAEYRAELETVAASA